MQDIVVSKHSFLLKQTSYFKNTPHQAISTSNELYQLEKKMRSPLPLFPCFHNLEMLWSKFNGSYFTYDSLKLMVSFFADIVSR